MEDSNNFQSDFRRKDRYLSRNFQKKAFHIIYENSTLLCNLMLTILGLKNEVIDISPYTTREIIATNININKHLFELYLDHKAKNISIIDIHEYTVKILDFQIFIEHKPDRGHVGNCDLKILYMGKKERLTYDNIGSFLKKVCQAKTSEDTILKERAIATIMLNFMHKRPDNFCQFYKKQNGSSYVLKVRLPTGEPVQFILKPIGFHFLITTCYLFCITEITRRAASENYYIGQNGNVHYGKDLPFFMTQYRTLKLLQLGTNQRISLEEVFKFDAPYGTVTGNNITRIENGQLKRTKDKIKLINEKYQGCFFTATDSVVNNIQNDMKSNSFKDIVLVNTNDNNVEAQDMWSDDDDNGRPDIYQFSK